MTDRSLLVRFGLVISSLSLAAVLLIGFKGPDEIALAISARSGADAPGPTGSAAAPSVADGRSTRSRGGPAAPTPATGATPGSTAAPAARGPAGDGQTFTGSLIQTRFGPVQVQITVANGTLADVTALRLPTGGRSGAISNYAGPILRTETLTAKSSSIQIVSGATYTSRAYQTSLQAALDQVHA